MVTVEGKIKGKARPRVYNGHATTPKDTVTYENWVKIAYKEQDGRILTGPIKATINVYYKVPKSYTKKRLEQIRSNLDYPCKKPDIDNVVKIILDSLNNIAYADDSQVVQLKVKKIWTEEQERVEFKLEQILN